MAARRHEISVLVLKIFHELAQRTYNFAETCFCSLHCSEKGKTYCHHGNANFSPVEISSIWGKAHLIKYFIGVHKINVFFPARSTSFLHL